MINNLRLDRPLAVIDLETTGTNTAADRIVEICVLKHHPGGDEEQLTRLLNPGIAIPKEATAIHGIADVDVADEPHFKEVGADLLSYLDGCNLCGYNIKRFDMRILVAEFRRAGLVFSLEGCAIIDPLEIFRRYEHATWRAAVRFYCGREHEEGHRAAADAQATVEVLDAMLGRYPELPRTVPGLHQHLSERTDWIRRAVSWKWREPSGLPSGSSAASL